MEKEKKCRLTFFSLINIDKALSSINDIDPLYGGFDKKRDNRAVTATGFL